MATFIFLFIVNELNLKKNTDILQIIYAIIEPTTFLTASLKLINKAIIICTNL